MKFIIAFCLVCVAVASPQKPGFQILRNDFEQQVNGIFSHDMETENGIQETRQGSVGSAGQINMSGSYSFTLPDGTLAVVHWVADEAGFRAESPLIPTPHPMPAHAIEQIRFAEEQRAREARGGRN